MIKRTYNVGQRCMAYILLVSLLLQSCSGLAISTKPVNMALEPTEPTDDSPQQIHSQPVKDIVVINQPVSDVLGHTTAADLAITQIPFNQENLQPEQQALQPAQQVQLLPRSVNTEYLSVKVRNTLPSITAKQANNSKDRERADGFQTRLVSQKKPFQGRQAINRQEGSSSLKHALTSQVFQTKPGQEVSLYQEAGVWKAKIEEKFGSLSRKLSLLVYFEGLSLPTSLKPSQIHIIEGPGKRSYVYIGTLGLPGGMIKAKIGNKKEEEEVNVVIRDIDPVVYIPGAFKYEEDEDKGELYAIARQPKETPRQNAQIYQGQLQMMPYEKQKQERAIMQLNTGKDRRSRIEKTTEWPYLFHGQLEMSYSDKNLYGGSGVLVGPQHILTAAHNIYDTNKKEWAQSVVVRMGLNDKVASYGEALAKRMYTYKSWVNTGDPAHDMALLVLDKPIGMNTGWCGLLAAPSKDLEEHAVNITGYPGDKGFKEMWTMCHNLKEVRDEQLIYEINTSPGQSGGGIWLTQ